MIRAILLDWNQTILGDELVAYGSVVTIFKEHGIEPPSISQYLNEITSNWMDFYFKYGFSKDTNPDYLNTIRKRYYEEHDNEAQIRPDARDTILGLKSLSLEMRVGIVSAEIESVLLNKLDQTGLLGLLDIVRGGIRGDKSPVLLEACKELNVQPNRAIYVDDTVDGTGAAKRAGLIPIGFSNGYNSPDRLRQVTPLVINQLSELIPLINKRTNFEIYS